MTQAAASEQEFIAVYRELQSSSAVAKRLGIALKNVQARRRHIERKYQIVLPQRDHRPAYNTATISDDRIEFSMNIRDGIVIIAGDQHYWPGSIPTLHRAQIALCKKLKPALVVNNGDSFDGASVSRFPDIGHETKPTVQQEIENLADRLDEILKASPSAKHVWNLGNHDMRYETYLAARVPQYKGVEGMHLKDHFPGWVPAWFVTINPGEPSHTEIRHREKGGIHAGYNNTLHSGINIVTGHDHRADVVRFDDRRGHRYAIRTGMLADSCRDGSFVNYLEGRKVNWQSAFPVLTYRDGRLMAPEHCWRVDDNTVEFRGELIRV